MSLERDEVKIRLRPHLERYEDSMARACYIDEADDVLAYLRCFFPRRNPKMEQIAQRYFGRDERNGWQSWLISLRHSPVLWTDKAVPGIQTLAPLREVVVGVNLPVD